MLQSFKCIERNVKQKIAKSWLDFREINFFGYVCRHKSYQVSPNKKEALANIPMPTSAKLARSLLDKGDFFSEFTPGYSDLVAHVTDRRPSTGISQLGDIIIRLSLLRL